MIAVSAGMDGRVCVASDKAFEGMPVFIGFHPQRRVLFLQFDDGRQESLGTSGAPEMSRLLHKTRTVRFMHIARGGRWDIELPLYTSMDGDIPETMAV